MMDLLDQLFRASAESHFREISPFETAPYTTIVHHYLINLFITLGNHVPVN